MKSRPLSTPRAWLQLLRPPNLFTVPGDPFAGYVVANSGILQITLVPAILASLCLYAAGLIMNDLADRDEDGRERPERPLPSGAVRTGTAWAVTVVLLLAGVAAAWFTASKLSFFCALGLAAALSLYNFATKRIPVIGALNMGLCRGLSVLVGGLAGPVATMPKFHWNWPPVLATLSLALASTLYIAAVTNLARHETKPEVPKRDRLLPGIALALAAGAGIWWAYTLPVFPQAAGLFVLLGAAGAYFGYRLFQTPRPPLPPLIGQHIRLLLVLQAAVCFRADLVWGLPEALVLLALWPVSQKVSRRFYAS